MTDKELQRLGRKELLEILLAQSRQIDALKAELEQTRQQLEDRKLLLDEANVISGMAQKLDQGTDSVTAASEHLRQQAEGIARATEALNQLLTSAMATLEQQPAAQQPADSRWESDWWESERRERERQEAERRERERQEAERRERERRDFDRSYDRSYDRDYDREYDRDYDRSYDRDYDRDHREYDRGYREYDREWSRGAYPTQRRDTGRAPVKRMHRKGGEVSGK